MSATVRRRLLMALVLSVGVATTRTGVAAEGTGAAPMEQLSFSLFNDTVITADAMFVWFGTELAKGTVAPRTCHWCDSPAPPDRWVRNALLWSDPHAAILPSNLGALVVAPVTAAGLLTLAAAHDDRLSNVGVDFLLVAQATALAGSLNQLTKFMVARRRPFAAAGLPDPDTRQGPADFNLSFYSGHTNLAFSLAAAAGTVATLRRYRWAHAIWIAGAVIGTATAYFRIAADQHYLTDVLTGAVMGTAVGVGVPALFHRPRYSSDAGSFTLTPATGGAQLLYARAF